MLSARPNETKMSYPALWKPVCILSRAYNKVLGWLQRLVRWLRHCQQNRNGGAAGIVAEISFFV